MKKGNLFAMLPVVFLWAFFHDALRGWWIADDPALLRATIEHGIWGQFYDPAIWRAHYPMAPAPGMLTPWINLTFGFDFHLFGLHPEGFYVHHFISFSLLLFISCRALGRFMQPWAAASAVMLFLLSGPSAAVVQLLQLRHYLEGFLLALLSIECFFRALVRVQESPRKGWMWALLGALLYGAATTAKEYFVPLVLWLPLLPTVRLKTSWRLWLPYVVMAALYVPWRFYMLGPLDFMDAYGDLVGFSVQAMLSFIHDIPANMGWKWGWQWAVATAAMLPLVWRCGASLRAWACVGVLFLSVSLPLLSVVEFPAPWYLWFVIFLLSCGFGYGLEVLWEARVGHLRWVAVPIGIALAASSIASVRISDYWSDRAYIKRYRTEGNFVLKTGTAAEGLLWPVDPWWHYYESLSWLRQNVLHLGPGPQVCSQMIACRETLSPLASYFYDGRRLVGGDWPTLGEYMECELRTSEQGAPPHLRIEIGYSVDQLGIGRLYWIFEPKRSRRYQVFISNPTHGVIGFRIPFPAHGQFAYNVRQPVNLMVHYDDGGRCWTSPAIEINPQSVSSGQVLWMGWPPHP